MRLERSCHGAGLLPATLRIVGSDVGFGGILEGPTKANLGQSCFNRNVFGLYHNPLGLFIIVFHQVKVFGERHQWAILGIFSGNQLVVPPEPIGT